MAAGVITDIPAPVAGIHAVFIVYKNAGYALLANGSGGP